jgi:hypothetical protein
VLAQTRRLPHPHEPARSVAEVLAAERAQLSPLPVSCSALTAWLEDEDYDG